MSRRLHVIINPAAGRDKPILNTLNRVFLDTDIEWQVSVTLGAGDAAVLAEKAIKDGVDFVGVYGGDGTLAEAASALAGTDTPLLIMPGGTANAFAREVGVSNVLAQAAGLIAGTNYTVREVDLGFIEEQPFLVAVGTGLIAQLFEHADREQKNRLGYFAYSLATLQALAAPNPAGYTLTVDGVVHKIDGVACYVANTGNFGIANISLLPSVDPSDGLLDVVIFRKVDLNEIGALAASMAASATAIASETFSTPLPTFRGKQIRIETAEPIDVIYDGELHKPTPVNIRIEKDALRVIAPKA